MRIYTLQIHIDGAEKRFDELYLYSDFNNMSDEFERRVAALKVDAKLVSVSSPQMDERGEVRGGFEFETEAGIRWFGSAYDYDILDED